MSYRTVEDIGIVRVWEALGGAPLRGGRGKAFWRRGDGYSVSIDARRGFWRDHVSGTGGGILALVQTAIGCDRREALAWLSERCGLERPDRTPEERREWKQRRATAETAAALLAERSEAHLADLRVACGLLLRRYHRLAGLAYETQSIELLARAEDVFRKLDELAQRRDFLKSAPARAVAEYFARKGQGVAA